MKKICLLGVFFAIGMICGVARANKKFVFVVASYKNERWCAWNIRSALNQKYDNYRIIYVDDCSPDKTFEIVQNIVQEEDKAGRVTLIHNETRKGALYNQYHAIHDHCTDDEIVVILDGDDALPHEYVLTYLNKVYSSEDVWLTYGQFRELNSGNIGFCCPMPSEVVKANAFRKWVHLPSHLRTYYAWLFKRIKKEDLTLDDGSFFPMTGDLAAMMPMIEMARDHFKFIPHILYVYNDNNPLNDHRVNRILQASIDQRVRNIPPYEPLKESPLKKS
jgi:glycosyltransferase involved in cell wall biosynthesis